MEWFLLVLAICLSIIGYHILSLIKLTKAHKLEQLQREYDFRRQIELNQTYQNHLEKKVRDFEYKKKTNIFRELAIDHIASQRLVYDEESGQYVRRRQIKLD